MKSGHYFLAGLAGFFAGTFATGFVLIVGSQLIMKYF